MKNKILENLEKIDPGLGAREYIYIFILMMLAGLTGFTAGENFQGQIQSFNVEVEVNSSNSIGTVSFSNRSVDFLAEEGLNTTFYLDRDRDGSADKTFDTVHNGEIHQNSVIADFPENIYKIYYRYQDSPEEESDGWMEIYRVEALK